MPTKHLRRLFAGTAAAALAALTLAPSATAAEPEVRTGPYQYGFSGALLYSSVHPDAQPQGANDWSCTPKAGTQPVILVHGTFANQYDSFARMAPDLVRAGHCVYSFNYGTDGTDAAAQLPGVYGTTGLAGNAQELEDFTNSVKQRTGTNVVDMVGWSQGGTLILDYLKHNGGSGVDDVVTFGGSQHGTTGGALAPLAFFLTGLNLGEEALGQAGQDQLKGSEYITDLTADGDTVPGVEYTVVATKYDQLSTPYRDTFLKAGPGASVNNITLQTGCGIDFSDHLSMMYSPRAIDIAKRALDPNGQGRLRCTPNLPTL